jgi:hypothetical protein
MLIDLIGTRARHCRQHVLDRRYRKRLWAVDGRCDRRLVTDLIQQGSNSGRTFAPRPIAFQSPTVRWPILNRTTVTDGRRDRASTSFVRT